MKLTIKRFIIQRLKKRLYINRAFGAYIRYRAVDVDYYIQPHYNQNAEYIVENYFSLD